MCLALLCPFLVASGGVTQVPLARIHTWLLCTNSQMKADLVFEAGAEAMRMLQGSYSCICLVHGVGTVAFRDPLGIR